MAEPTSRVGRRRPYRMKPRPQPPRRTGADQDKQARKDLVRYWAPVILTVVGLMLTAIPIYLAMKPDTREEFLDRCHSDHPSATRPPANRTDMVESRSFAGCSWPPVAGAASDGFYQVRMMEYAIPGSAGADQFNITQVFESSCRTLLLQYKFENQTTSLQGKPLVVDMDQIVSMYDGSAQHVPNDLWLIIGADSAAKLFVLSHYRYDMSRVECVNPP